LRPSRTLEGCIAGNRILSNIFGGDADALLKRVKNIHIIACGTGYHADFVARYCFKALAGLRCVVEVASEYRYRAGVVPAKTLFVAIPLSQSGETADGMAALCNSQPRLHRCGGDLQRARILPGARIRPGAGHARERRDRPGLDHGLYHPAGRSRPAGAGAHHRHGARHLRGSGRTARPPCLA